MSTLKTNNIQHVDRSDPSILINTDGSVSIAGTVTYEDVTSVDSVGIVTARTGIDIIAGDLVIPDSIIHRGDTNTKIRFPGADVIAVETAGTERIRIKPAGDIGIGTDDPKRRLHVTDYGTHGAIRVEGSGNGNRSGIEFFRETSAGVSKGGAAIWVESDTSNSNGKLRFGTASNAGVQSQNTDMILDHNGHLGIGTDNPDELLELGGTNPVLKIHDVTGGSTHALKVSHDGVNATIDLESAGLLTIKQTNGNAADNGIAFNTGTVDTEKLRITSDGMVGVGVTNPAVSGGYKGMEIGGSNNTGLRLSTLSNSGWAFTDYELNGTEKFMVGMKGSADADVCSWRIVTGASLDSNVKFLVTENGNVGVGTDSPIAKLNVNSGTTDLAAQLVSSDANVFLAFKDGDSTGNQQVQIGGVGNDFVAYAGGNERFRIDSNGTKIIKNGNLNINSAYIDFSGSVSTPSTAAAIYRPADNQLAFSTGNNERLRMVGTSATNGRILIGRTASSAGVGLHPRLQIQSTTTNDYGRMELAYSQGNVTGPGIYFTKTRGSTADAVTSVNSGDQIGALFFLAADGTDRANRVAEIQVKTEGTIGNDATPGKIIFSTTPAGSNTCLDRLTINSTGVINLSTANNTYIRGGIYAKYTGASGNTGNINTSSSAKVSWLQTNTEIFENGGFTNTATDVTIPKTGIYMITFNGYLQSANIRTNIRFRFRVSGTDQNADLSLNNYIRRDSNHDESSVNFSAYLNLSAGDTVAVAAQQMAGSGTVTMVKNLSSLTFHLVA